MSNKADEEVLDKILKLVEDKDITIFTPEEVTTLRRVVKIVSAFDALGTLGSVIKNILLWLSVIIGIYLSAKNGFITWVVGIK